MRIQIPNVTEVIIADVYIQSRVSLSPLLPIQKTQSQLLINQLENKLNEKVYSAIQNALKDIEDSNDNTK